MEMGSITIHGARAEDARTVERCREGADAEGMRSAELRQELSAQAIQQQRVIWIRDCADDPSVDEDEMPPPLVPGVALDECCAHGGRARALWRRPARLHRRGAPGGVGHLPPAGGGSREPPSLSPVPSLRAAVEGHLRLHPGHHHHPGPPVPHPRSEPGHLPGARAYPRGTGGAPLLRGAAWPHESLRAVSAHGRADHALRPGVRLEPPAAQRQLLRLVVGPHHQREGGSGWASSTWGAT